jgi:hypothetical protein
MREPGTVDMSTASLGAHTLTGDPSIGG